MADGVVYIKIAKIDKNGNNQTNTLQSLNQLIVPYSTGDIVYKVNDITEKPTFFLYSVDPAGVEWADRAEIKYDFTGSLTTSSFSLSLLNPYERVSITTPEKDSLNFYNSTTQQYILNTYPQKDIYFILTGSYSSISGQTNIRILANPDPSNLNPTYGDLEIIANKEAIGSGIGQNLIITGSYTPTTPGTEFLVVNVLNGFGFATTSFTGSQLFITSSDATGQQVGLVPEPYFGSNDFNRALDCQPLLNNVERVRRHNLYQDVDYSAGATEPVNFDLLISGSATRAEVQFSNYTTKRVTIPRYEGSKSTSQKLNTWTKGDVGTFGKTPTVESLKTVIAYCDWIGGWPPERNNSSAAHILYLIDSDGNIGIPNTSENSLSNVQGAFQTGERFRISSKTVGSGPADQFRTVIRGGKRIEPILYSQYQAAPNQQWNTTMSFEDIIPSTSGNTNNYLANNTPPVQSGGANAWQTMKYTWQLQGTLIDSSTSKYTVPSGVISDGVTLRFYFYRSFISNDFNGNGTFSLNFRITKKRGSSYTYYPNENGDDGNPSSDWTPINLIALTANTSVMKGGFEIPSTDLATGDEIYIEYIENNSLNGKTLTLPNGQGWFTATQYPSPTSPITSSGYNSIWNWGDANNYPYIITSSNQTLVDIEYFQQGRLKYILIKTYLLELVVPH